jgi:arylsulfatase A-like enzyme
VANVLLIIADDLGVNALSLYGLRSDPIAYPFPNTPIINALKTNGIMFKNVWSNPTCSPTRAGIQTGRYGFRTGIGGATLSYNLPQTENIIPEVLNQSPQLNAKHALIGKWHLSNIQQNPFTAPNDYGYQYFAGTQWNIPDYCNWPKFINGVSVGSTKYATTENADDAISWISNNTQNNWFMTLAFNAPHSPYHNPPQIANPNPPTCSTDLSGTVLSRYQAMIERLDYEIGRVIATINLTNTTVIFVGDNGTPGPVTVPPFDPNKAKVTIYEGGIRVPLVISYHRVLNPNRIISALINTTDIFATVLDLMGATIPTSPTSDSRSLVPLISVMPPPRFRTSIYSEKFPNGNAPAADYCIRNQTYKYIKFYSSGLEEFYNLVVDPYETNNLIASSDPVIVSNINALRNEVLALRASP